MTKPMKLMVGLATVALAVAAFAGTAAAKAANPCKIITTKGIAAEFGATVGAPDPGTKTAVSVGCDWDVAASASVPAGTVSTRLMTTGAKVAYNGLKTTEGFAPVPGLPKSLYQSKTGALSVLDGSTLVTVQGVFLKGPPIVMVDVLPQLTALMKDALKRV